MAEYDSLHYCKVWTDTAIDCYNRGCKCEGCVLNEIVETRCHMKQAVLELVRKFGAPKKAKNIFTNYELRILDAIKNGCETFYEIAIELNKPESSIISMLHGLYRKARGLGWTPRKKGIITKSLLPQFIKWVRGSYEKL